MDIPDGDIIAFKGAAASMHRSRKLPLSSRTPRAKLEWVAKIEAAKDVKIISSSERVEYNHAGTPWPLTDHDSSSTRKLISTRQVRR